MTWTRIVPLGDQAALASFDEESAALHFAAQTRRNNAPWLIDVVQAYSSVAVFFDPDRMNHARVVHELSDLNLSESADQMQGRVHRIPCCYELALDLDHVAEQRGLSREEVIRLHAGTVYTVYAIGFCPGYPFMGYLPEPLAGVPRRPAPRLRVEAGSVGITGRQTGIYTEPRPGGWSILGRTPLTLVDVADNYFPLRTGDRIQFEAIDRDDFERFRGERLPAS